MPTFDGDNLIMTLDAPTASALTQNVEVDWYNAWKDWQLESYANRKYPPVFFDSFGGNDLTPGIQAGAYFVFQNDSGWRIRSSEEDQTVYVVGNVAPSDSALPITIPTIGGYTVLFDGLQPITQNIDTIKTTLEFTTFNGGIYWDAVGGKAAITDSDVDGNEANPLMMLADVQSQAVAFGFTKIYVIGSATIGATDSVSDYEMVGQGQAISTLTFVSGCTTSRTVFSFLTLTGDSFGAPTIRKCELSDFTGIGCTGNESFITDCIFEGTTTLRSDNNKQIHINQCVGGEAGVRPAPILDVNVSAGDVTCHKYGGTLQVTNISSVTEIEMSFDTHGGALNIAASCTTGNIALGGDTRIVNNSGGTTIANNTTPRLVWEDVLEEEGSITAEQAMSIGLAALAGEVSISGDIITFKTPNGNVTRMVSTTDSAGQRTAITLTP